ncbi:bifunctional 3'-5' exonuclease/DNA polymerase [Leucobacter chromiireducens]|uniref:bifunctional 3'-5' exonuclease/DNA polymerase n=1 Tax=Leucobacter chromiireducens TaxID=283877 RepID=UPI003075C9F4
MPTSDAPERPRAAPRWWILGTAEVGAAGAATCLAIPVSDSGAAGTAIPLARSELPSFVAEQERRGTVRWVWSDTPHWVRPLLDAGVRVARCHDLRLCHAILTGSAHVADPAPLRAATAWAVGPALPVAEAAPEATLFELGAAPEQAHSVPHTAAAALAEFTRQRAASQEHHGLRILLAAESAGALIAAEMSAAGLPWDAAEHNRILESELGPRPAPGAKPARMIALGEQVRAALGDPHASLDSPPKLVRSLRSAGIDVASTSKWELMEHEHPAIAPLLSYKKLARLLSANGWAWLDEWVRDGRYRPVYVPGGVVTGRWASSGGGALQLPRQLRPALRADPGWRLVSADVAQLEPRVLAATAGDRALAAAARGSDLYTGIVASGAVATRDEAKFAMLGAMYGATTGEAGRLAPRLRRSYPAAMGLLDRAAATGERGGQVSTRLGRTSPLPSAEWRAEQGRASLPGATPAEEARARRAAREQGRFTRNFVVQGTAAEWALAWLGGLRGRLAALEPIAPGEPAAGSSGRTFAHAAHLVFFLHDEVIVHAPESRAEQVAAAITAAAADAGALLFPGAPIDFPLDLRISERSDAK